MKQLVLEVTENKYAYFLEYLKKLDFVTVVEDEDDYVPQTKEEIMEDIRQGMREIRLIQEGKLVGKTAEEFIAELKNED